MCLYMGAYTCTHTHTHTHIYIYTHMCIYIYIHVHTNTQVPVHMYIAARQADCFDHSSGIEVGFAGDQFCCFFFPGPGY